jgi:hypothetical protein
LDKIFHLNPSFYQFQSQNVFYWHNTSCFTFKVKKGLIIFGFFFEYPAIVVKGQIVEIVIRAAQEYLSLPVCKGQIILKCLFSVFNFHQKNEQNQVKLRFHSRRVEFVRSFFGGNVCLKKLFRLFLTFSRKLFLKFPNNSKFGASEIQYQ